MHKLAGSAQGASSYEEVEARSRLVKAAWSLEVPIATVQIQADTDADVLFMERKRRINLTRVRSALNGYQHGRCFYCGAELVLGATHIDHFFPHRLKRQGLMPDADSVWNLVLGAGLYTTARTANSMRSPPCRWSSICTSATTGLSTAIIRCAKRS